MVAFLSSRASLGRRLAFTIPKSNPTDLRIKNNRILIPKVGYMKITRKGVDKYKHGEVKQATVKLVGGKWYASLMYKLPEAVMVDNGLAVGIDMNCHNIATSDGQVIPVPDIKKLQARRKRYQRKLARQQKGSNRRNRTKRTIASFSRRIANKMQNWRHQHTTAIANKYGTVVLEDLRVANMSKSAKGTAEKHGKNVKQKAGLNREIRKVGWRYMRVMWEYKATNVIAVPPHHTSQRCSQCGHTEKDNRKTQAGFKCLQCKHELNADINAALNILAVGMTATGRARGLCISTPYEPSNWSGAFRGDRCIISKIIGEKKDGSSSHMESPKVFQAR